MKYIEELNLGDTFSYKDNIFVLTSDFNLLFDKKSIKNV